MIIVAGISDKVKKFFTGTQFLLSKHLLEVLTGDVFLCKVKKLRSYLIYCINEVLFNMPLQINAVVYRRLVPLRIRQYKPWNESPFFMLERRQGMNYMFS